MKLLSLTNLTIGFLINGSPSQHTNKPDWAYNFCITEIAGVKIFTLYSAISEELHRYIWNTLCIMSAKWIFVLNLFFISRVLKSWPVVPCWMVCLGFPCEPLSCLLPQAVKQSWQQLGLFLCHRQTPAECSARDAPPVLPWQQAWRWRLGRRRGGHCSWLCCQVLRGAPVGCCCAEEGSAFAWKQVCSEERVKYKHFRLCLHSILP